MTNGVLTVDTFVNVETKNMQAPDGMQSTATYVVKIDPSKDSAGTKVRPAVPAISSGRPLGAKGPVGAALTV